MVGALHVQALLHAEDDAGREHDDQHQRQDRMDGHEDDQRAEDRERTGQDVLGAVVRQFDDLEQVVGDAGQEDAGPVVVEEAVGQLLHVREDVPAHVRFHHRAHAVSDHSDKILTHRTYQIRCEHDSHHDEESPEEPFRQESAHRPSRHIGEGQVHHGDAHGQGHVDGKGFPVGLYIGGEDLYFGAGEIFVH